jgi:hypothetical protein
VLFDEGGKNFGQHAEGIFLAYGMRRRS